MENTSSGKQSGVNTATTVNTGTSKAPISQPAGKAPVAASTGGGKPAAKAGWDYKSDSRWGKIPNGAEELNKGKVWSSESDIIQGYHDLEEIHNTKYKPTFEKFSSMEKLFKENQLDISKIDEYLKNYQTELSPDHPRNQIWQVLNELVDDEVTAHDFQNMVKKLREEKDARRYPGMTEEQRKAEMAKDKQIADMQKRIGEWDRSQILSKNHDTVLSAKEAIKKMCSDKGFEFTDNIWKEFANSVMPKVKSQEIKLGQLPYEFLMKYGSLLDESFENKFKAKGIESANADKNNKVIFSKKPNPAEAGKSPRDRLKGIISNVLNSSSPNS